MTNIQRLRDSQLEARNPGHEIGTFLIQHSNNLEYLVAQLEMYLEAGKADLHSQNNRFRGPQPHYRVVVGNIGTVKESSDRLSAFGIYNHYACLSESGLGSVGGEPVYLFRNEELIMEHAPKHTPKEACDGEEV